MSSEVVAPGLHRIECEAGGRLNAMYLFAGTDAAMLVDTGIDSTPTEALKPYLHSVGFDPARIRYVLNTHSDMDHTGGNVSVAELAPEALLMCHELDRPMVEDLELMIEARYGEFAVDHGLDVDADTRHFWEVNARHCAVAIGLRGGERFHLGDGWHVEVVHTPGHSWGSVSVLDTRSGSLVLGDAILGEALVYTDGRAAFPPTYRYLADYLATMDIVSALAPDALLTSHFPVMDASGAAAFVRLSRNFTDRVEEALRGALQRTGTARTLVALSQELCPALGSWEQTELAVWALASPLAGHLELLAAQGMVDVGRAGKRTTTYQWVA